MARASGEAAALLDTLAVARPGIVRPSSLELERSLTLAAATAAGTISWKLWQAEMQTSPQLALQRFGNLDGLVQFTNDRIEVRLPLGRRHQELFKSGLLSPVGGVPWLGGRRVEFGGG